ncbi:MAG: SDR family NAD(P)-dependent oxidoreductase [Dehalococcoidales bacterium]|nr:SDR family NAD(P)-dependent oxidoreductase [Dehalococcoidales bacterium]
MKRLSGKIALVTGTTSGIGHAILELFAREGALVMGAGRRRELGEAAAGRLAASGAQARFACADVSRRDDVQRLVEQTVQAYGGLDIVVNNAAVGVFGKTVENTTEDEWDYTLAANLKSVYLVSKEAVPHLRRRGGGAIVNVGSVHAYATTEGAFAYAAAKGGVLALTREMALDLARYGIRVNTLIVGAVDTAMLRGHAERAGKTFTEMGFSTVPNEIGRIGQPHEIAEAALFLSSDAASFITGAPLVIDGGLLARL